MLAGDPGPPWAALGVLEEFPRPSCGAPRSRVWFCPGSVYNFPLQLRETRAARAHPGPVPRRGSPRWLPGRCPVSQRPRPAGAGPGQSREPPG